MSIEQQQPKIEKLEEEISQKEKALLDEFQKLPEASREKILGHLLSQETASESSDFIKNIQTNRYDSLDFPKAMGISCRKFCELIPDPNPNYRENLAKVLLVISEKKVPLEKQLELLNKIYPVDLQIKLKEIKDFAASSEKDEMYWLYDLDYGKNQTEPPLEARKLFEKQGRRGLTFQEALALIFQHPNILKSHFLLASGSSYKDDYVPYISLDSDGKITIGARSPQCNMACFGNPSRKGEKSEKVSK